MRLTLPKRSLQITHFTCVAALCANLAGAVFAGPPNLQETPTPATAARAASAPDRPDAPVIDGNHLMQQAAHRLRGYRTIQAKVRQRVQLFGRHLAGKGVYLQAGRSDMPLWRLEIQFQAGEKSTIHQQICDGDVLWIRQSFDEQPELRRIDLQQLRRLAAARLTGQRPEPLDMSRLGGLTKIVDTLTEEFDFNLVRSAHLGEEPVWLLRGRRRAPPDQDRGHRTIYSPAYAQVLLSRSDDLPLFPYRIEYFREPEIERGADKVVAPEPLLVTEWYEIRINEPLDPRLFNYQPDDTEVIDDTQKYLARLEKR